MDIHPNATRGRRALRHPVHIYVCNATSSRRGALFDYHQDFPARPPDIMRRIGVNWLRDKNVAYGAWAIFDKSCVRDALKTLCGEQMGLKYFRRLPLNTGHTNRSQRVILIVQTDALLRLKHNSLIYPVAASKKLPLFDSEDLACGCWATANFDRK